MSKAIVNALAMALAMEEDFGVSLPDALDFATAFVEQNGELFISITTVTDVTPRPTAIRPQQGDVIEDSESIRPRPATSTNTPGLSEQQAEALAAGIPLCPNCQQPVNDHIPGCARVPANGFEAVDKKAVTKAQLPRVSR